MRSYVIMIRYIFKNVLLSGITFSSTVSIDFIFLKTHPSSFCSFACGIILLIYLQWLWCLSRLCEVSIASDLATVDCIMSAEMIHTLVILLERAAVGSNEAQCPGEG